MEVPSPPPPPVANSSKRLPKSSIAQEFIVFVAILLITNIATAIGVYTWQHQQVTSLQTEANEYYSQISSARSGVNISGINIGQNTGTTTESTADEISQTLNILSTYYKQHAQYPLTATVDMTNNFTKYGFLGLDGHTVLYCPSDTNSIVYYGRTTASTGKVDQFTLQYCDGYTAVTKSQADITQ